MKIIKKLKLLKKANSGIKTEQEVKPKITNSSKELNVYTDIPSIIFPLFRC
jgi:hypothetical protein